jgi:DUF4097 and DUF4098 domain-containing protein YvlB
MVTQKTSKCLILAFLLVVPLSGLDPSTVQRGAPVRRGRAWEQRAVYELPVKEGGRLVVRTDAGAAYIKPEAVNRVKCEVVLRAYTGNEQEARRLFEAFQLDAHPIENGVYVNGQSGRQRRQSTSFHAEFNVSVPVRYNLDVETQGGDISVDGALEGEARLTTAGGDIRTSDVSGTLRAETAGGSITLANVGSRVDARTAGGSIRVGEVKGDAVLETSGGEIATGQVNGTLRAETAGGDVVIGGSGGPVVAQTAGGQIQIGAAGGSVHAETAGGSIRLQGARGRVVAETAGGSIDLLQVQSGVSAKTAAGRILAQFDCTKKTFGPSELASSMGDVYVYLPPTLPLTIDAAIDAAVGHKIISDFPIDIRGQRENFVPETIRGQADLNGGGDILRIRTVSGNIEIRKLDAKSLQELQNREASTWKAWQERRAEKERRLRERDEEQRQRQRDRDEDNDKE